MGKKLPPGEIEAFTASVIMMVSRGMGTTDMMIELGLTHSQFYYRYVRARIPGRLPALKRLGRSKTYNYDEIRQRVETLWANDPNLTITAIARKLDMRPATVSTIMGLRTRRRRRPIDGEIEQFPIWQGRNGIMVCVGYTTIDDYPSDER